MAPFSKAVSAFSNVGVVLSATINVTVSVSVKAPSLVNMVKVAEPL